MFSGLQLLLLLSCKAGNSDLRQKTKQEHANTKGDQIFFFQKRREKVEEPTFFAEKDVENWKLMEKVTKSPLHNH